jgi:hypothetical protein
MTATNQSTAVALATATEEMLPALLEQELAQMMMMEGFDYRPGKIGIMHREKKFMTPDGQALGSITGVIVYFHKARGLWLVEGEKIPTCSSMNGKTGTYRVSEEQTQEMPCANCQYNQFGSDPKGGGGKACKEMRRIFLVEKDAILPAILNIPPTSLKSFDAYMSGLVSKKKAHIAYETTFRLEGASQGGFDYSKVVMEQGAQLPNAKILELMRMREQVIAAAEKIGIEEDDYMGEAAAGKEKLRDDKDMY